jgi:hypothetical protein
MSLRVAKRRGDPVLVCFALVAMTVFYTLTGYYNTDKFFYDLC